jgi:hypothetical protein
METKKILRIMPLGDSVTAGYTDNPYWKHPFSYGYRAPLYTILHEAHIPFTFVGASIEPWNAHSGDPTHAGTVWPKFSLTGLGQDNHRGYGGWSIQQIVANIELWLQEDTPDLILLMIGINGISSQSPFQLRNLVEVIFRTTPKVFLLVAQISPLLKFNQDLIAYNTYIKCNLVSSFKDRGFSIDTVDQYSSFLHDPQNSETLNPSCFSNGINHPTHEMYRIMAEIWFKGINLVKSGDRESSEKRHYNLSYTFSRS